MGADNAYVRPNDRSCPFLLLDWDPAGWGPPAADLQPLSIGVYSDRVRASWRDLSRKKLSAAALAGSVFRQLDVMELRTRQPDWLRAEGLERLTGYDRQLRHACLLIGVPMTRAGRGGAE